MPTRSRLSGRPSWRTSSVRSSGLGPNWSPSSLVARSPGAKNGKSDMSSYSRDTTLVNHLRCIESDGLLLTRQDLGNGIWLLSRNSECSRWKIYQTELRVQLKLLKELCRLR